jgi:ribonuclease D
MDRLPASARAVARSLAAWREREADRLDLARPFLLRDETLLALAKRDALAPADAAALPGYDARRHAHQAPRWVTALQAARADVAAGTAPPEDPRTPADVRDRQQALEVRIAALVTQRATELGLASEQLLSRRQRERAVETWLRTGGSLAAAVGGFRGAVLGPDLDALTIEGDAPTAAVPS